MYKVGLTGGIASGKSTVGHLFASQWHVPVIDADEAARYVVQPGMPALDAIVTRYGQDILTPAGELDRPKLRQIIFNNDEQRHWLEQQLHPEIRQRMQALSKACSAPYVIWMIPLLLENNMQHSIHRILVVDCSEHVQIDRCTRRNHVDLLQVQAIMATQVKREQRLKQADDIIHNETENLQELQIQVANLHKKYLDLSKLN